MAIRLNSKHLKVGDQIIRNAPLYTNGVVTNSLYTSTVVTVLEKHPHHLVIIWSKPPVADILPFYKWNDDNWVRWK